MKVPNSKIQAPEKHQDPKLQRCRRAVWCFEFGDSLELGDWDLELKAEL
jgi:hypothetical protein